MKTSPSLIPHYPKLPLIVLVVLLLIPFLLLLRHDRHSLQRERIQDAFIQQVESQGGRVVLAPADASGAPPALLSVDLSGVAFNGELIERLSRLTSVERLNLDGAELANGEYGAINRMTKLRHLSLAGSTVSDDDLPWDALQLTGLSLRNTSITDTGLSRLAEMTSLANLDITGTAVTAAGLSSLRQFSSFKTLDIDDACITQGSVKTLQSVTSLKVIRIRISDGLGQRTRELLSPLAGTAIVQGLHPSGEVLWNVDDKPWDETLAGIVELVADEVDLDPQQVTQLIIAVGSVDLSRPPKGTYSRRVPEFQPNGKKIASVDEFLRRLHDPVSPPYEVRVFARDHFTKDDVPALLEALRPQSNFRDAEFLYRFGAYLLVRDGLPNPKAAQELSRMLSHEDPQVRSVTAYGFDRYGHPFNEDWAPSEAAVEFGLPWLFKLCNDPEPTVYLAAGEVIGDLAYHHPNRTREVMTALVGMLERGRCGYLSNSIGRILEVNPEAARASIPQLRRLLEMADDGTIEPPIKSIILATLCDLACTDPTEAHDLAVDYVGRIRDRKIGGGSLQSLVAPENPAAVRAIVHGLLDISTGEDPLAAERARNALVPVVKAIRNYRNAGN